MQGPIWDGRLNYLDCCSFATAARMAANIAKLPFPLRAYRCATARGSCRSGSAQFIAGGRSPLWVKVKNPNAPAVKRARLRRIGGADRGRQETRVTTIALSRSRTYLEMNNKRRL
jgi:hypothetical protein